MYCLYMVIVIVEIVRDLYYFRDYLGYSFCFLRLALFTVLKLVWKNRICKVDVVQAVLRIGLGDGVEMF